MKIRPEQIKAVFTVLTHYGITKNDLYEYFAEINWGYGEVNGERRISIKNLEQWQVHELFDMIHSGAIGAIKYEGREISEGWASSAQLRYAEFLFYHYRKKKYNANNWKIFFYKWLDKYTHADDMQFVNIKKATKILTALEHMYITTFGTEDFNLLTDKKWAVNSKKFKKYNKEAHDARTKDKPQNGST